MKRYAILGITAAFLALILYALAQEKRATPAAKEKTTMETKDFAKPADNALKDKLTPLQYKVTQMCGTEPPFQNAYWDNKKPGIYVDVVSGEPLFSSLDKFDSGTGWPSFTKAIEGTEMVEKTDRAYGMVRTEVKSRKADSHLGHLFDDGPAPTGQRYCINSASLRFVPVEKMEEEGYGKHLEPFVKAGLAQKAVKDDAGSSTSTQKKEKATLAGGCFWGVEEIIRKIPGVLETAVGYTGGTLKNPTYKMICTGVTGHAEALEITFDPDKITYEEILDYFFRMHDPTTLNRQHNDVGTQYRSAIFYHSEEQKKTAESVKEKVNQSGRWKRPVVTEIVPAKQFYVAEDYHQDYLQKNPGGYNCHYLRD